MKRDVYSDLVAWKRSTRRKPLLVRGARQTGKTFILKEFGKSEYQSLAYFNFEEDPQLKDLFAGSLKPGKLVENLSLYQKRPIRPALDLIVLDEIQASNEALNALKYFQEDANDYHVAAAGSLLGVKLSTPSSFPVGKVNFIDLHPMSFLEFLDAVGEGHYRQLIEAAETPEPIPLPFHEELVDLLRRYYFVGGMPEAVRHYAEKRTLDDVRAIQKEILNAYVLDFAKHAPVHDIQKLSLIWDSIPFQLARENRKFLFSALKKSARSRDYETAVLWLEDAGLILRCFRVSTPGHPLKGHADRSCFKVYALDVGLLGAMANISSDILAHGHRLFEEYKGAFTENYVAQQLRALQGEELYYWKSEGGVAEVDFLCQCKDEILPLEVKSGVNPRSKSLRSYDETFHPSQLVRTTLLNLRCDGRITNIPLYALSCLTRIMSKAG
ncbi:MAG: ATP-binding protein [bacterium]